jgi:hydroxymethylglutaryl-CoA reductase (NADPH)
LLTLVFPNSLSPNSPQTAPVAEALPIPKNTSATSLPTTLNPFSPISQDTTLAFSVPWDQTALFLHGLLEIPEQAGSSQDLDGRKWVMRPYKNGGNGNPNSLRTWGSNAWSEFVDLLKVRCGAWDGRCG